MYIVENKNLRISFAQDSGAIISLKNNNGKEFISNLYNYSFASLYFYDNNGERVKLDSNNAVFNVLRLDGKNYNFSFFFEERRVLLTVFVSFDENSPFIKIRYKIQNGSGLHLDKVDLPQIVVPNDLVATGGKGHIFTPLMEGAIVDDITIRDNTWMKYHDVGFPACGWEGIYPGATPIQFMSYFDNDDNGLYFAAHDAKSNPKVIEFHQVEGGIKLEYQFFTGKDDTTLVESEYDIVLGVFEGDWYDAAEIYRQFIEQSDIVNLPKLRDNTALPNWLKESPIVVCYPVRGEVDSHFEETSAYYPYTKAIPYLKTLTEKLNTKLMPLLMHWEGTAPWAPPYVWPPFGDKDNFDEFIKQMHEMGNYVGVYCSGIAWTQRSALLTSYDRTADFEKENLKDIVALGPKGELQYSNICGSVGFRYDMCPACEKTRKIACDELEKIVSGCDVDYIQFFDQVLGGGAYACYETKHGHSYGPGRWQTLAMKKLFFEMKEVLRKHNKDKDILIGCEGNAAEPFINECCFNDSRHNINYFFARPVPAYNYVFHEYLNNFMGNQNTSSFTIDFSKHPNNIYMRYAHAFAQGDVITIVLKDKGKIHWDWCTPWNAPEINQDEISAYINELSSWRKNIGKEALQYGRMVKPFNYTAETYTEEIIYGGKHNYSSIESTCFVVGNKKYQFFVNYLDKEQKTVVNFNEKKNLHIIMDSLGKEKEKKFTDKITLVIKPRSVKLIIVNN